MRLLGLSTAPQRDNLAPFVKLIGAAVRSSEHLEEHVRRQNKLEPVLPHLVANVEIPSGERDLGGLLNEGRDTGTHRNSPPAKPTQVSLERFQPDSEPSGNRTRLTKVTVA